MNENLKKFLPGGFSSAGKEREARLARLSPHVTGENMHGGSPTSLEYARLAVEIHDEYLKSIEFLLASPFLPSLQPGDREKLEAHLAAFRVRREKAQFERVCGWRIMLSVHLRLMTSIENLSACSSDVDYPHSASSR